MTETDPEEIKQWLDQDLAILIDVREHQELAEFSIPGALHNPMSNFNVDAIQQTEYDVIDKLQFLSSGGNDVLEQISNLKK